MKIESIAFSANPKLSPLNSKEMYLCESISVWIDAFKWVLPKGLITDLRSGPAIINPLLPKWGSDVCQCILLLLHDYNYGEGSLPSMSKKEADDLLVEGLRWTGHPKWKCSAVGLGLSIAGGKYFRKEKIRIWNESKQEVQEL